jgi:methylated-DNA-[protein]-cysteine S-methyltransferase
MIYTYLDTPLGPLLLAGDDAGLKTINFQHGTAAIKPAAGWEVASSFPAHPLARAVRQLNEYFDGRRRRFDLALAPTGTPFQQRVWRALREIPYGETISYAELARRIGEPRAVRAVGAANGRNPLPVVVPCHRVIGSDGTLTGFRGGVHLKAGLLDLERRALDATSLRALA